MAQRKNQRDMGSELEKKIISFLRKHGCVVKRTDFPSILFLKEGFWGAIECKASARAKFQPGQKEMVAKLNDWSYATIAHPGNWDEIKKELDVILG